MSQARQNKGPKSYRFFVSVLNILLFILTYWLLGFLMDDISSQPGPSWEKIQKQYQDPVLVTQKNNLLEQEKKWKEQINTQSKQQSLLQKSTDGYRDTMNQLLDQQKLSAQKSMSFSAENQQNLASATKLFLDNQQKFQNLNNTITQTNVSLQQVRDQLDLINEKLDKQTKVADEEYNKQLQTHNLIIALCQLALLIPLLIITILLFRRYGQTIYRPMIMAIGLAIVLKIAMVMHDYFPSRFFKYILILILIALVTHALIKMLRMLVKPKSDWLLKQYKEAYKKLQCPSCEYPIRPGIVKYAALTQDKLKNLMFEDKLETIEQYSCPCCGIQLYEKCPQCKNTRHSLFSYCEMCGSSKN